jgi:integrase
MAIVARTRKSGTIYYACNKLNKRLVWERVGSDRRDAERRDSQMKREIKLGIYCGKATGAKTVASYADGWLAARAIITADHDRRRYRLHVKRCPWFLALRLEAVDGPHIVRLADELRRPFVNSDGDLQTLAPKTHAHIGTMLSAMFKRARFERVMIRNPFENLPPGTFDSSSEKREPYEAADVIAMTTDERVPPHWRMLNTILFYTGMRIGEACGLRFEDFDPEPKPLGCLTVSKQYGGLKLKTAKRVGDRNSRKVPVHPTLAAALHEWWQTGFEQVYLRKPELTDFIVQRTNGKHQTRHNAYVWFRSALQRLGIENRSMHSARNTFISLAVRAGARESVLDVVTHRGEKAAGRDARSEIRTYIELDWLPLCEAVLCFQPEKVAPRVTTLLRAV